MKRDIIKIDQDKCNGCGDCITGCPEGAIALVDGKAKLVKEFYCDGLGACIGNCPVGAITIEKRETEAYDELSVIKNIVSQGPEMVLQHLRHLDEHGQDEYLGIALDYLKKNSIDTTFRKGKRTEMRMHGCPGSRTVDMTEKKETSPAKGPAQQDSQLRQWPVQLHLLNPQAPYFNGANLLIAADCVPFAYPDFHNSLLRNKVVIIFCPKLDHSNEDYIEKLTEILSSNDINSITIAHMEVPCCFGTVAIVEKAIEASGKSIPLAKVNIGINGQIKK